MNIVPHEFKAAAPVAVAPAPKQQTLSGQKACRFCRHQRPVEKVLVAPPGPLKKPWPRGMWVCGECRKKYEVPEPPQPVKKQKDQPCR